MSITLEQIKNTARQLSKETNFMANGITHCVRDKLLMLLCNASLVIVTHDDDFLSMAMEFEHSGIAYVHQEKYKVGDLIRLIRKLKLLWETSQFENMINRMESL